MSRAIRMAACVVGLEGCLLVSAAHAASDDPVQLSWLVPEQSDCPDATYVQSEIRRYVASSASAERAAITANVTIRRDESSGFRLVLSTIQGPIVGERVFRDQSCRALADAAVLILAWMIAPDAMANRSLPAASREPPPVAPAGTQALEHAPEPTPKPMPVWQAAYFGLGAAVDSGTLPSPAIGAKARMGISVKRLRFEARAAYWPSRRETLGALSNGAVPGASFSLWSFGVQVCFEALRTPAITRWALSLCTGPEAELLHGAGFGVTLPASASKSWFSWSAGITGRVVLTSHLSAFGDAAGVIPTERDHFGLKSVGELYRPSSIAGRAALGLEFEL
jgi:hypothetical protein